MRTTTDKKDNVIKVRVSYSLYNELEKIAKRKGISISEAVREAVKEYIRKNY